MRRILSLLVYVFAFSNAFTQPFPKLSFDAATLIPHNYTCDSCNDLPIGGLSGIAYDQQTNQYYFVADKPPSRYYNIQLDTTENIIRSYDGVTLLEPSEAELESIRFRPGTDQLYKANEHARSTTLWEGDDLECSLPIQTDAAQCRISKALRSRKMGNLAFCRTRASLEDRRAVLQNRSNRG
jgi:hypothetical protein